MKIKLKKKSLPMLVVIAISVVVILGGVFAYLTDYEQRLNIFKIDSNFSIELTEPKWDEENGKAILPGEEIEKDPTVKNTGDINQYVYMTVSVPTAFNIYPSCDFDEFSSDILNQIQSRNIDYSDYGIELFSYEINDGWVEIDEAKDSGGYSSSDDEEFGTWGMCNKHTYYYNKELKPGEKTPALFNKIKAIDYEDIYITNRFGILIDAETNISRLFAGEPSEIYGGESYWNDLIVNVEAKAIQSSYLETGEGVLNNELINNIKNLAKGNYKLENYISDGE